MSSAKTIMVTGGAGFIGSAVIRELDVIYRICELLDELAPSHHTHVNSYKELITFVKDRPGHDSRYAIDTCKIRTELGWEPTEDFTSGLRKTVDWYLDNPAV